MKNTVKKVPVILQMEALECGAASLAMILAYYKKYIPLEKLRLDCNVSRDGSTAKYIILAAKHHNMNAKGFRMSIDSLKKETEFPVIIHWNFNHFVVLCGFYKDNAVINDPAAGRVLIDMVEFDRSFTGIVLKFSPSENFLPLGKPKSMTTFIRKRLKGNKKALAIIVFMGFILSILELIKSVFYKIFTDNILLGNSEELLKPVLMGMFIILIAGFAAESLKKVCLSKLKAKMCIGSSSTFMWHILRLPVEFFSQRFAGDIASRQQSNNDVAEMFCNGLAPAILDILMIFIYIPMILYYDFALAAIGIIAALADIFIIKTASAKNANDAKTMQRDRGKLSGITVSAVSMIETIKSSGAEFGFFEKIAGYRTKYNNSMLHLRKRNIIISIVPEILSGITKGIVLIAGAYYILVGKFTVGYLMAFQGFMSSFLSPVNSVAETVQNIREMSGDMERIEDVTAYPADINENVFFTKSDNYKKLSGELEIKDLCFAYSPLAPNLIENFSLKAEKGKTIALVGGSGSGKSTIAKIVSGLYPPRSGEILFDGVSIKYIDRYVFTSSVAVVDQNISLFEGTIKDNITMWDDTISEEDIVSACKDACIHNDIMSLLDGYEYIIKEGGANFSGGQRQRLEIARAFAVNPSVIILDEATSALDPITEKLIMDSVKQRGITCLIIAHRLSTIRDADEIIMLEYGIEVERGSHKELIEKNGRYAELIRSE